MYIHEIKDGRIVVSVLRRRGAPAGLQWRASVTVEHHGAYRAGWYRDYASEALAQAGADAYLAAVENLIA